MREYKVVVLGSGGVGKSALTVQFVTNTFIEKYDPTIEDFYRKEIEVDANPCVLEILDTAGTEQFSSMRDLYIRNGEGFVVVYSITSHQTFHDIRTLRDQIVRVKGSESVPVLLVANKCDLQYQRQVKYDEGRALAEAWGCPFVECSAKIAQNVNTVFAEIVREMNVVSRLKKTRSAGCGCIPRSPGKSKQQQVRQSASNGSMNSNAQNGKSSHKHKQAPDEEDACCVIS